MINCRTTLIHKQSFHLNQKRSVDAGRAGVAGDIEFFLCYTIYNESEGTITYRSEVRSALDGKLRSIHDVDPISFDSSPDSNAQYMSLPVSDNDVQKIREPHDKQPRHGCYVKSDRDERTRKSDKKDRKQNVLNETVVILYVTQTAIGKRSNSLKVGNI